MVIKRGSGVNKSTERGPEKVTGRSGGGPGLKRAVSMPIVSLRDSGEKE
jgi:hypothetical protein